MILAVASVCPIVVSLLSSCVASCFVLLACFSLIGPDPLSVLPSLDFSTANLSQNALCSFSSPLKQTAEELFREGIVAEPVLEQYQALIHAVIHLFLFCPLIVSVGLRERLLGLRDIF